jgi:hypothetical protein
MDILVTSLINEFLIWWISLGIIFQTLIIDVHDLCCFHHVIVGIAVKLGHILSFRNLPSSSHHFLSIGCKIWSLTYREKYKLQVFQNQVLRKIFGSKKDGVSSLGFYMFRNFMIYTDHLVLLGQWNEGQNGLDMEDKKCIHNFNGEIPQNLAIWKAKEMRS